MFESLTVFSCVMVIFFFSYVGKLCEIFQMCEDLENMEALHLLYQIARDMFMLNRNDLLEVLLQEKYFK